MKKFLSLVLALVMTMSLVTISAGAKDFTDDSKTSYKEAVDVISGMEIVGGYADGSFNPQGTLTRGAAAKIICNLLLGPTAADALGVTSAPFKDVPANHTFAGYIAYCSSQKIISGYSDGTFRPAGTVNGFAFLKMLLGALGYDGVIEKFTGTNWSVNVAKLAIDKGLTKGNDTFVGSKAMTREEAALYALNTLKADLVDYATKGTNITTSDGTVINVGASKAEPIFSTNRNISNNGYLQFGEKYFEKLKLTSSGSDAFERPANTWNYKTTNIGTYAKTPDVSYTETVKLGTIYSDLGLGKTMAAGDVFFHVDGAVEADVTGKTYTTFTLSKGNSTEIGGNGVTTEVYYDTDSDTATVVMVNTYGGKITGTYKATSSKDAYVSVSPLNTTKGGNFDTTDFAVDDVVVYTYSEKSGDKGVQSVALAEQITGTLSGFTADKSVTVGGTTYKFNKAAVIDNTKLNGAVKYDVTITLDANGYVVDVDTDKTSSNYAVVLNTGSEKFDTVARLLLTDGTTKDVTVASGSTAIGVAANQIGVGDIVSYSIDNKDAYKLTLIADQDTANVKGNGTAQKIVTKGESSLPSLKSNVGLGGTVTTANGKTIFLVATMAGSEKVYTAYVGIKNVPTIKTAAAGVVTPVTVYSKAATPSVAEVVFIDATVNGTVSSSTKDVIFVKGVSDPKASYDSVKGTYYVYDAIINGEIKKVEATNSNITSNTLFTSASFDKNNIYTLSNPVTATVDKDLGGVVTGTKKVANDVVGLGNAYYGYSNDVKVFLVDADGDISASSISGITDNVNAKAYFKITDGEVTTIVVQLPKDDNSNNLPGVDAANYTVSVGSGNKITVNYYTTADKSEIAILEQIQAKLVTDGYTSFTTEYDAANTTWTIKATKGAITIPFTWKNDASGLIDSIKVSVNGVSKLVAKGNIDTLGTAAEVGVYAKVSGSATAGDNGYKAAASVALIDGLAYDIGYYKATPKADVAPADAAAIDTTANKYSYTTALTGGVGEYDNTDKVWYVKAKSTLTMTFVNAEVITATTKDTITVTAANSGASAGVAVDFEKGVVIGSSRTVAITDFAADTTVSVAGATS